MSSKRKSEDAQGGHLDAAERATKRRHKMKASSFIESDAFSSITENRIKVEDGKAHLGLASIPLSGTPPRRKSTPATAASTVNRKSSSPTKRHNNSTTVGYVRREIPTVITSEGRLKSEDVKGDNCLMEAKDMKDVKDFKSVLPSTESIPATPTRDFTFPVFKREGFESLQLSNLVEAQSRQRRRSAAPSPVIPDHLATMQRRSIRPQEIGFVVGEVLRPHTSNPGFCPCGWYHFYAVCGHMYMKESVKCGAGCAPSGVTAFCSSPAPIRIVDEYVVDQPCSSCLSQNASPSLAR